MAKPSHFPEIQLSLLDGRAETFRYREAQLYTLFEALKRSSQKLKVAIQADYLLSATEADLELATTLSELRHHYEALDPQKELEATRQVEKGAENVSRAKPVGIVYIIPSRWSLTFSIVSALSAAMAAGCCAIVELPQTLSEASAVLRKIMVEALSSDTFAVATTRPPPEFTKKCMLVNQTEELLDPREWSQQLLSRSISPTVAIVDRTASVDEAGSVVADISFTFGGKSAYVPRVVLVDEFSVEAFLSVVIPRVGNPIETKMNGHSGQVRATGKGQHETSDVEGLRTIAAGSNGRVVEAQNKEALFSIQAQSERTVLFCRTSSLDNSLSILKRELPFAACFLFAAPPEANYLSRYINADICAINSIPTELFVGPVAPVHSCLASAPFPRYNTIMFTNPAPQYLPKQKSQATIQANLEKAMQSLRPIVQGSGSHLNFFGQAIFVGLGMIVVSFVGVSAGGSWLIFDKFLRGKRFF